MNPEFVDGLIIKAPREGAPEFVKGSISIKREELIQWLSNKQDEWINLDIKESRGGKWYAQINTWKPEGEKKSNASPEDASLDASAASSKPAYPKEEIDVNDIPF